MMIRIILYILSAVSLWYGFMIFKVHSGSMFYLIWMALGIAFTLVGIALKTGFFKRLPMWVNITLVSLVALGVVIIAVLAFIIVSYSENDHKKGLDYIIVLGAQVNPDGPSRTLKYRLDAADEYLKENPGTICIVSGGKGDNEPQSEASVMKAYLVSAGIDGNRIILEDRSTITDENIEYSKKMIPDGSSIGIVTNNFHLYRAIFLCNKHGLENVSPIRADSNPFYAVNNYFREVLAFIKDSVFS